QRDQPARVMFFAFTSCREEKGKTETVIIEKPVEKSQPEEKPKTEESDGTSLSVDGEGVEFSTKNGDNETDISIKE
ncbi:MAG: hypothetical protein ACM31G_07745, partial [Flavobacteriales bacterium]